MNYFDVIKLWWASSQKNWTIELLLTLTLCFLLLSPPVTFSEIFQRHTAKLGTVHVIQLLNSLSRLDAIGYGLSDFPCFPLKWVFVAQASFSWVPNHCHPVFVLERIFSRLVHLISHLFPLLWHTLTYQ